ncbi:hypothetical protein FA13DRAFT_1750856 [Coprinellus micaceus]|uniref:MYND-type domain-containing protein n=1 Tax=Coprinellus micaceus TaxID=71717 RepID=A0A4Y7R5D8_COPMI|nr:hypothetical protein FA13DRAFT_1750856 [Coprinellus micaceus]
MALYLGSHGRLAGSVSLAARRTKSYEALIERWYDVVQWLSYLVQNAAASSRFSKVVQNCSFFLLTKYFADLTFLMLYQEDPDTETYYNMPNNGGPDGDDSILRFVLRCFDAPASRDYLTSHFRCLSKEVKGEIAREYIAYVKTAYLAKAVRDLQAIIVIFRWLIEDGGLRINSPDHEPGYIKEAHNCHLLWTEEAEAAKITDTGLWTTACEYLALLSRTVSLPVCAGGVRQLMEGAAPYLYRLYTYLEARQLGDKRWGSRGKEDAPIDICSNMTHASTQKKKNRCHAVAYCSAECQQVDWTHLHARECSTLARVYQDQKSTQAWPSLRRKGYTPSFPSPKDILKTSQLSSVTHRQADPSGPSFPLLRFDPNSSSLEFAWKVETTLPWLPRFQQFVDAVERNPASMILVEGRFRLNHYNAVVMFATMRYHPERPVLERYAV